MARLLRINLAGAWYHVSARGNECKAIFRDERDRVHFLELFGPWQERFRTRLHAFVLMDNHYHLFLETGEANLSRAMQWLNVSYTVWFNRRHQRVGHLLQGRFKAVVVEREDWGLSLSRYIHLNPVRVQKLGLDKAGRRARQQGLGQNGSPEVLKARLALLRDYRWSSYRAYAGYEKPPPWLDSEAVLALGGGPVKERRKRYRADCQANVSDGDTEKPWEGLVGGLVLGSAEFAEALVGSKSDAPVARALSSRPSFAEVVRVMEGIKGEPWLAFRDRRGDWGRDLVLHLGRELGALTLPQLQAEVATGSAMAVSAALRRFRQRLHKEKALRKPLTQALKQLADPRKRSANV
jgi:putative transposase